MKIPTKEECLRLLREHNVPDNIIAHSKKVCEFSLKVADILEKRGIKINRDLVAAAALLHDIKKLEPGEHEIEGAKYIESLGYHEVVVLIKKHGLKHSFEDEFRPKTWEEKIIFYADKRCIGNRVASLEERFQALEKYYKVNLSKELRFTKKIEKELVGEKV